MSERGGPDTFADLLSGLNRKVEDQGLRLTDFIDWVWSQLPITVTDEEDIPVEATEYLPLVCIAAVDAPQEWIQYCSASPFGFVCDGVEDEVQFMEAEVIMGQLLVFYSNSIIWLSPGNFNLTAGFVTDFNGVLDTPLPWGTLTGRYKGHGLGHEEFLQFTNINVNTGWADIQPADPDVPGELVPALNLNGEFEGINFEFIPDGIPDGDMFYITGGGQKLRNLHFKIGSSAPIAVAPVICQVAVSLDEADSCTVEVYRQGVDPTQAFLDIQDCRDIKLDVRYDGTDPELLPNIFFVSGTCRDITFQGGNDWEFQPGACPIIIAGDSILSDVRILGSINWDGVNGVVQVKPSFINSDNHIVVDVSTFLVDTGNSLVPCPRIFYKDAAFDDIVNLGSRVLHGTTLERPDADKCIGTIYVNTTSTPVMQFSNGTTWVNL